ncbi:hypothetical protein [Flavobacterium lindanitolerans]|jgi:hypothetical protein|uniref:hypothetical protein n=1 Tax=Flavobacterium lindanitolerans TaxID=428988 RepID=UPI0023F3D48B|nr:hypothetical protein [Flavobacterium lindanitolerans]
MHAEIKNHEKIYEKLVSILDVKFKTQLKGTEMYFKSFYSMKNLITEKEDFLLIFEAGKAIRFSNKTEFINEFIDIVRFYINSLDEEYNELLRRERKDTIINENEHFLRHEEIGYCGEKLLKLLNKLKASL